MTKRRIRASAALVDAAMRAVNNPVLYTPYGPDEMLEAWQRRALQIALDGVLAAQEDSMENDQYCAKCGAHRDNHAPGGSRYGSCTYEPRRVSQEDTLDDQDWDRNPLADGRGM